MKTMNELRDILSTEIDSLRNKQTTAQNLNAVVNAIGKILTTVKMEIEYAKVMGKRPVMDFITLEDEKPIEGKRGHGKSTT